MCGYYIVPIPRFSCELLYTTLADRVDVAIPTNEDIFERELKEQVVAVSIYYIWQ